MLAQLHYLAPEPHDMLKKGSPLPTLQVILVDIRSKAEVKEQGTPDLKSVKRKAVTLPYTSASAWLAPAAAFFARL